MLLRVAHALAFDVSPGDVSPHLQETSELENLGLSAVFDQEVSLAQSSIILIQIKLFRLTVGQFFRRVNVAVHTFADAVLVGAITGMAKPSSETITVVANTIVFPLPSRLSQPPIPLLFVIILRNRHLGLLVAPALFKTHLKPLDFEGIQLPHVVLGLSSQSIVLSAWFRPQVLALAVRGDRGIWLRSKTHHIRFGSICIPN
mmetsp:Transcript_2471/g.3972  ORF Transcript_2471/g.3972 Transcript_2471/m.3972 type:complete len:202 (+) Transcript_2471:2586-3191(+)